MNASTLGMIWAWVCGSLPARADLLEVPLAAMLALAVAQFVTWVWPQPRPFATQMGTQYLEHVNDPGLLSDQVTFFWGPALSALFTRRFAPWGFPLHAVGLATGSRRVCLSVHFPHDILAALPWRWRWQARWQRTGSRAVLRRRSSGCSTTMRSGGRPLVAGIAVAAAPEVPTTCASS